LRFIRALAMLWRRSSLRRLVQTAELKTFQILIGITIYRYL
jgi:hypothetical protein